MKALKTILLLSVALCFATACKKEADMTLRQKTVLENTDISKIHVDDAWEVTLVYDSLNSFVELEYSAFLEDYLYVKEKDQWLEIGFNMQVYKQPGTVFRATVHTSEKQSLSIKGEDAAVITMKGHFEVEEMNIELYDGAVCNGSQLTAQRCGIDLTDDSHLYGVKLNGTNCTINVQKGSSCNGYFTVEQTFTAAVGNSSYLINFEGSIPSASIEVKEASSVNLAQAEIREMSVSLEGASEATVNVSERIEGSVKEVSTLYYKGHPQLDVECSEDSQLIPF